MSNSADRKRWAILPPPSATSTKISGEFSIERAPSRKRPARRTVSGELHSSEDGGPVRSSFQELEPSDSERPTEVPESDERAIGYARVFESGIETIPAPRLPDDES